MSNYVERMAKVLRVAKEQGIEIRLARFFILQGGPLETPPAKVLGVITRPDYLLEEK